MKKILIFLAATLVIAAACKTEKRTARVQARNSEKTLFTVGDEVISGGEFKRMFEKNNPNADTPTMEEIDKYLDLYIKFKLKVSEAKALGLDTQKSYIREMEGYKHQLAQPYLTDKAVTEELIQEAYDRSKTEIKASHILIRCSPLASPKDTLEAYNKLLEAKKKFEAGTKFEDVAVEYSEDPSVKQNKGDLGYFSVFNMIYEFENAAYETPVGQVSMPFRTKFGYHVVYVTDKREARGEVKVAHIFIRPEKNATEAQWQESKEKIVAIKNRMELDESFADLAKNYSDDPSTKGAGGEIGWLKSIERKFPPDFVDACFELTKNGEVSEPFRSEYGWHIIKRLDYKAPPTFEEQEYYLKTSVSKDSRSSKGQKAMVEKIKEEKNFTENKATYDAMQVLFDSTLIEGRWIMRAEADSALLRSALFTLGEKQRKKGYNVMGFILYARGFQSADPQASVSEKVRSLYNDYVDKSVLEYKEEYLEEDNDSFRYILTEYREGILLFEFMQNEIWNKAITDTAGRNQYYEEHKDNYMWKQRTDATIYRCQTKAIADSVEAMLKRGEADSTIAKLFLSDNVLALKVDHGKFEEGNSEIIDKTEKTKGIHNLGKVNGVYIIVKVNAIEEPTHKTAKEAQGKLISDYQEYLEEQWVEKLREKYLVEVNRKLLNKLFTIKEE